MKKIIAFLSTALLVVSSQSFAADAVVAQPKIAVVNVQQVLLQSSKVKEANAKLQAQFKPMQDKLNNKQKSLQDAADAFAKDAATMSVKDRDAKDKELTTDKANFLKEVTVFQKEVSQEQNKVMQGILNQLSSVITDMAKKSSYNMVLDSQAVVYSSDTSADITAKVNKEFNDK